MPPSNTDHLDAKLLDNIECLRDDGSNWRVWKAQTLIALEHREVLEFIDPLNPQPSPKTVSSTSADKPVVSSNANQIVTWDKGNRVARMQVFMTLEHSVADLFDDKEVASQLWVALRARFEGKGLVAVAGLAAWLWRYVMLLDKDMMVQIQEIKNITSKLKNLGYPLSEEYQVIAILIALPHEWSTLRTIILNKSGLLTLQDTIDSIVEHETMLWQQHDSAMVAHHCPWFQTPTPQSSQPTNSKMFLY